MGKIVKASSAHRRRTLRDLVLLFVVGGYGGQKYWNYLQSMIEFAETEATASAKFHLVVVCSAGLGVVLILTSVAAVQCSSLGYRIIKAGRYPVLDMNLLFDTKLLQGTKAKFVGLMYLTVGFSLIAAVVKCAAITSAIIEAAG